MTIPQGKIIIGIGCDRGAPLSALEEALDRGLALTGRTRDAVAGLATIDKKSDEAGLLALSTQHSWPISFYSAAHLAKVPVPNPSETVRKHMGTPAVSEAAALLAAGVGAAETGPAGTGVAGLILEKYKYRGNDGKHVTISIAEVE
uniref:Cobalt-precorrin 5A hydrolase n=1 Tax=Candidatus Kentrum sp. FW TaxID=2126338 RepID=A0A450U0F4_9GAMM|nr:MAG: cobalt-precorrin 5A hydrolase [Candidatus Kentron sp. FW]